MTDRALEQRFDRAAVFTFAHQRKDRVELLEIGIDHSRRVLGAYIDSVARQITLGQHFLGDEGLVGQCVRAVEGKPVSAGRPK